MKNLFLFCLLALTTYSFGQNIISTTLQINEASIDSTSNEIVVTIKLKNQKDIIVVNSVSGRLAIPPINGEIKFVKISYRGFEILIQGFMTDFEARSYLGSQDLWRLTIDTYPHSAATKTFYPKLGKSRYMFTVATQNTSYSCVDTKR